MPRDGSGIYTLPAGNPVVTGTPIASPWANSTLSDIAAQLNNVLTRDGLLGPTGAFKLMDGTVAAPGLAWNSEPGLGFYRKSAGVIGVVAGGAQVAVFNSVNSKFDSLLGIPDGSVGAPGLFFNSDPGLGFYRAAAGVINAVNSGLVSFSLNSQTADSTYFVVGPRADGASYVQMWRTANTNRANTDFGYIVYNSSGLSLNAEAVGTGTRKSININSPAGVNFIIGGRTATFDTSANFSTPGNVSGANLSTAGAISATGAITGGNLLTSGIVRAAGDLYCDNGNGTALIGLTTSGGFPKLRWSGDNWRLEWQSGYMRYYTNGNAVLWTMDASGSQSQASPNAYKPGGGSWIDSSDERLKENVQPWTTGLDAILGLEPVTYNFKEATGRDTSVRYTRLIAQQAKVSFPELVTVAPGKVGDIEYEDLHSLNESPVLWALVNAVKTLNSRIAALEATP